MKLIDIWPAWLIEDLTLWRGRHVHMGHRIVAHGAIPMRVILGMHMVWRGQVVGKTLMVGRIVTVDVGASIGEIWIGSGTGGRGVVCMEAINAVCHATALHSATAATKIQRF